jgi:glycine betaine/proline transport system ATP-binding protein
MVFQSFALMPHLDNLANAAFGLEVAGVERGERQHRARNALETVGLGAYAQSYPHELSGGMQQRVGLARALAVEPGILLMDEAFSALDPLIRLEMQEEIRRIQRERDLTVMFISHDLDEALHVGDRLAIMEDGAIVQTGTPQELVTAPATDYVHAFFANVNLARVFTAGDLARRDPAATVRLGTGASAADTASGRTTPTWLSVLDEDGSFAGVVDGASYAQARAQDRDLRQLLERRPVTLSARLPIEACIAAVADTPYPVPVLRDDCFVGTLGRRDVLRALAREQVA